VTTAYPHIPAAPTWPAINRSTASTLGQHRKAIADTMSLAQYDGGHRNEH
jgi:hypothetical protein